MARAWLVFVAVTALVFVCAGCVVTPNGVTGGGGGGGGGGYYPSTYSITLFNNHRFGVGWVLTPPRQRTALESGYLPEYSSVTISGLSGSYDVDIYIGGWDEDSYAYSYPINGGGSIAVDTPADSKAKKNLLQTIDVDSDSIDIIIQDLGPPTNP